MIVLLYLRQPILHLLEGTKGTLVVSVGSVMLDHRGEDVPLPHGRIDVVVSQQLVQPLHGRVCIVPQQADEAPNSLSPNTIS